MTRAGLASINCTSCGAGLNVLGGGRVVVHVCSYCGAELDAQENYKVLRKFDDLQRPDTPFRLGMEGTLFGVDWIIVGTIGMKDGPWRWVEHQLYSPTHGYAWLNVEEGNYTFSRRVRKVSHPSWMDSRWVESAESRPQVLLNGERFRYYETSDARITFLEGEFTWAPQIDDTTQTISALSDEAMLDFSQSGVEREMHRTIWLDPAELAAAFKLTDPLGPPLSRHPLMPFKGGTNDRFMTRAAAIFAAACIVLSLFVAATANKRDVLGETAISLAALPQTVEFPVTQTDRLVQIDLGAHPSNAWLWVGMEVLDPEGETLFESGRAMEFYSGRDSDGTWTEGNRTANLRFRPPAAGTYQIIFNEKETELWISGSEPTSFTVSAREGVRSAGWLGVLGILFGLVAVIPLGRRLWHRTVRFSGSDWTDED